MSGQQRRLLQHDGVPELPDIKVYVQALKERLDGRALEGMRITNPFVVRTVFPRPTDVAGLTVTTVGHQAKRIVIALEGEFRILIHLMIAGRLHWKDPGTPLRGRNQLAALYFETGTLVLTEAGAKRRAAIHLVQGEEGCAQLDRGGLDPLAISEPVFGSG